MLYSAPCWPLQSLNLHFIHSHSFQSVVASQKLLFPVTLFASSSTIVFRLRSLSGNNPSASRHIHLLLAFFFCLLNYSFSLLSDITLSLGSAELLLQNQGCAYLSAPAPVSAMLLVYAGAPCSPSHSRSKVPLGDCSVKADTNFLK